MGLLPRGASALVVAIPLALLHLPHAVLLVLLVQRVLGLLASLVAAASLLRSLVTCFLGLDAVLVGVIALVHALTAATECVSGLEVHACDRVVDHTTLREAEDRKST